MTRAASNDTMKPEGMHPPDDLPCPTQPPRALGQRSSFAKVGRHIQPWETGAFSSAWVHSGHNDDKHYNYFHEEAAGS